MEKKYAVNKTPVATIARETPKKKPADRISAIMQAAEAAGYGPHYGQFMADHPDAFKDWEPGKKVPEIEPKVYEYICRGCGRKFTTTNKLRRYCDDSCKARKNQADHLTRKKTEEMQNA